MSHSNDTTEMVLSTNHYINIKELQESTSTFKRANTKGVYIFKGQW